MRRTNLVKAVASLRKEIEICKNYKKRLLENVEEIKNKCLNKEIAYYEYERLINRRIDGKSIQEWLDIYDSHIKKCENKIKKETKKFHTKKFILFFSVFVFILLLTISFFYFKPLIVGSAIENDETNLAVETEHNPDSDTITPESSQESPSSNQEVPTRTGPSQEEPLDSETNTLPESDLQNSDTITPESSQESPSSNQEVPTRTGPSQEEPLDSETNETFQETLDENLSQTIVDNISEVSEEKFTETITNESNLSAIVNESTESFNQTIIENQTIVENVTFENITAQNVTIENITTENMTVTTLQYKAVIGQPVKWKKQIILEEAKEIKIKLPKEAKNISVSKADSYSSNQEVPTRTGPSQEEPLDSETKKAKFSITGQVIRESEEKGIIAKIIDFFKRFSGGITGRVINEQEGQEEIEITIDDNATVYEIEYETESPKAYEEDTSWKNKRIIISGPDELHYENVLAYTNLSQEVSAERIKLYHVSEDVREIVEVQTYDLNENGLVDYIEWNVPHLSNQTYELIIEITKAEHLDSERNFISDVYELVKEKEDVWFDNITNGEYLRVTFKIPLDNTRDITLYARGNGSVEVYEKDGTDVLINFNISGENWYKEYLTQLEGEQDTFDLRIVNGSVEFDYVVDPMQQTTLFADGFEVDDTTNWTKTGGWARDSVQKIEGSWSEKMPNGGGASNITSKAINSLGYDNITVYFSYRDDDCDVNDVRLFYNDSFGNWDVIQDLASSTEDTWNTYSSVVTDSQYLHSDFSLRIVTNALSGSGGNQENFWVDNVSIVGNLEDNGPPTVTLLIPENGQLQTTASIVFNCSAISNSDSDLANITLYGNWSTGWHANQTVNVGGSSNYSNFTKNLIDNNTYLWNCYSCSQDGLCSFASSNFSFLINTSYTPPPFSANFEDPTPDNGDTQAETYVVINTSIEDGDGFGKVIYNWNGTNTTYLDNSLMFAYNFENLSSLGENNTHIADITGHGWDANLFQIAYNSTYNTSGKYGSCWYTGGSPKTPENLGDFIYLNESVINVNEGSVEFWFNPDFDHDHGDGVSSRTFIDSNTVVFSVFHSYLDFVQVYFDGAYDSTATAGANFHPGNWYHMVAVYNRTSNYFQLYFNGSALAMTGASSSSWGSNSPTGRMYIAARRTNSSGYWGRMDEVKYYNRTLSASEVTRLYMMNLRKFSPNDYYLYINQTKNVTARLDNGTYTYEVFVEDNSSNTTNSGQRSITINTGYSEGAGNLTTCQELNIPTLTYTLQNNITDYAGTCFNITADNIILNGNGFLIDGDDSGTDYGIYALNRNNITIKNFRNITDFGNTTSGAGVYIYATNNSFIQNLSADSNYRGVYLYPSSNNTVSYITANSNSYYGIYLGSRSNNNTLTNITVNSNPYYGIFLATNLNNTLTNITANSNSKYGVYLSTGVNNTLLSNITANSNSEYGIILSACLNNTFSNITANSNFQHAIFLYISKNNTINNLNSWNCSGINSSQACIFLNRSSSNVFDDIHLNYTTSNAKGIYLVSDNASYDINSSDNYFKNVLIENIGGQHINITRIAGSALNNTFVNATYNISNESVSGTSAELIRKWYFDANVSNSTGVLQGANMTCWNVTNISVFSQLTNSSGQITKQELAEYRTNSTARYYATPHVVNTTYTGYANNSTTYNLTAIWAANGQANIIHSVVLQDTIAPNITLLTPANQTITSNTTINFTANVSDFGSGIKNITLWVFNQTGLYNQTIVQYGQGIFNVVVGIPVLMVEGIYTWFFEVWDYAANFARSDVTEGNRSLTIGINPPIINFAYPTPDNSSRISVNYTTINVSLNENASSCMLTWSPPIVWTPVLWVPNYGANNVTKLNSTTGAVIGTYPTGTNPYGVALDAFGNVWITNYGGNSVTKLDPNGNLLGTYSVGTNPYGIAIDPSGNAWVTNSIDNTTKKLNSTGGLIGTYNVPRHPIGVVADASGNVWVANYNIVGTSYMVTKLNGSTGAQIGNYTSQTGPYAITVDGSGNVWVGNSYSNTTTKYNGTNGSVFGNYSSGYSNYGIAIDSSGNAWVANRFGNTTTKLSSSGSLLGTYKVGKLPYGIAVDDSGNIWVANRLNNNMTKLYSNGTQIANYSVGSQPYALGDMNGFVLLSYVLSEINYTMEVHNSGAGTSATYDISRLAVGENYTYSVWCNDTFGSSNESQTRTISLDTTFPLLSIISPANTTYNATVSFNVSVNENASWCGFSLNSAANVSMTRFNDSYFNYTNTSMTGGFHNVTFACNDTAGNMNGSSGYRYFSVDADTPPQITIVSPANTTYGATVSFNVSSNEAISWCGLSLDGADNVSMTEFNTTYFNYTNSSMIDGFHNVTFACNDTAGNMNGSSGYLYFTVDSTAPNITLLTPANETITSNTTINFSANVSDFGSGIKNITLWIFNQTGLYNKTVIEYGEGIFNVVVGIPVLMVEGIYNWFFEVWDYAANLARSDEIEGNRTLTVDVTYTQLTIVYPGNTTYDTNVSELNYSYTENNTDSCWYSNDSGTTNSTALPMGTNFTSVVSVEGVNTWTLYCNDSAGNVNLTSVTFSKDTVVPQVNITSPLNDTYISASIDFNITLGEPGYCEYSLDSGITNYTMSANATDTGFGATNSSVPDGTYTVTAYCNDSAGNENYSQSTVFSVDVPLGYTEVSDCRVLNESNTEYRLTTNVNTSITCFNVTATNVTLNCNGFKIIYGNVSSATTYYGVYSNKTNTTIQYCNITDGTLSGGNIRYGVYYDSGADNGTIEHITTNLQYTGIYLYKSGNNTLRNITSNSNAYQGIYLITSSSDNQLSNITANLNGQTGIYLSTSSNSNNLTNITANSNDIAGIYLATTCNYNNFTNIITNLNGQGITLFTTSHYNRFTNVIANSNNLGVYISSSSNNTLINITADSNDQYGIYLTDVNGTNMTNITATSNSNHGIYIDSSSGNILNNSNLSENSYWDLTFIPSSDADCSNTVENTLGSGGRSIRYYNSSVIIEDEIFSELILCNADDSSLDNLTVIGSSSKNNSGLVMLRTDRSNLSNINSSNNYQGIYLSSSSNNTLTNLTTNLNNPYGVYFLTSSRNNVTNLISNSNGNRGIYVYTNSDNNRLVNLTTNSNSQHGTELDDSVNNTLLNITANSNSLQGVYIYDSDGNNVTNVTANSNGQHGVDIYTSIGNNLTTLILNSNTQDGLYLVASSNNTIDSASLWSCASSSTYACLYILGTSGNSDTNTFTNLYINSTTSTGRGIRIASSTAGNARSNLFKNVKIENVAGGDNVRVERTIGSALNTTFVNATYNSSRETVTGANTEIIRKWYFNAIINNSVGYLEEANVTSFNITNESVFSELTNSSGQIVRQEIIEYIRNNATANYSTPHVVNTSKTGYPTNSTTYNLSAIREADNYANILHEVLLSGDTPPQVTYVGNNTMTDVSDGPNEGTSTPITINLTVSDTQGASNINSSTVGINFSKTGEDTRYNSTCVELTGEVGELTKNFTCTVVMWWWDSVGTWNITAYASDNEDNSATNDSTTFAVGTTTGFVSSPSALNWSQISPGATNQTANNDPVVMNNTGNVEIALTNIQVNATNLLGEQQPAKALWANNFSVGPLTGGNVECSATTMVANTYTGIALATLPAGNYTKNYANETSGQEQLYFCLKSAGSELTSQSYSTYLTGSWTIKILFAMFVLKKRKKKQGVNKVIQNISVPSTIFSKELGALEALTKYLKENLGLSYHKIAEILNRDQRTVWTAYNKAIKKQPEIIKVKETDIFLPASIFKNRKLTILEAMIIYLKQKGLRYSEIAKLLDRDQRNIWTVYNRATNRDI